MCVCVCVGDRGRERVAEGEEGDRTMKGAWCTSERLSQSCRYTPGGSREEGEWAGQTPQSP